MVRGGDAATRWLASTFAPLTAPPTSEATDLEIAVSDSVCTFAERGHIRLKGSFPDVIDRLVKHVNRDAYHMDPGSVKVHGAAVRMEGIGVALSARSGSGKSTLTTALVRRGWDYLSDEIVAVQLDQPVLTPYPKPISLKEGAQPLFPDLDDRAPGEGWTQRYYAPDLVRPGCVSGPVPLRLVVFPRYGPGATAELTPVHRADSLYRLCEHTFDLRARGADGVFALARAIAASETYDLVLDDLDEAEVILRRAAEDVAGRAPGEPEAFGVRDDAVAWAVLDGRAVLMDLASANLAMLDEAGTQLWRDGADDQLAPVLATLREAGFAIA